MWTRAKATRHLMVSVLLIASMLFYVSGLALGIHLQLEHSPTTQASNACSSDCSDKQDTPEPGTPKKHDCRLCDMLTGVNKPTAVLVDAEPLMSLDETGSAAVFVDLLIPHFLPSEASPRGPPILL